MSIKLIRSIDYFLEELIKNPVYQNVNKNAPYSKYYSIIFSKLLIFLMILISNKHIIIHLFNMSLYFPSLDIYCCGLLSTRKSDCTGLPQNMLVCSSTPAQRGQSRVMMKGSMSLISWYNKGHFRFLTNAYSPTKQGERLFYATVLSNLFLL